MLSDEDRAVLDFAGRTYRYPGARETDLLEEFGWSAVTYWVKLDGLLDRPDAEASHPRLVRRLRSLRNKRRRCRTVDVVNTEHP